MMHHFVHHCSAGTGISENVANDSNVARKATKKQTKKRADDAGVELKLILTREDLCGTDNWLINAGCELAIVHIRP